MSTLARRLTLILAILLLLVLTSCIRMTMDIDIDGAERIDVRADVGMQNAAAKELGADLPDFCAEADLTGDTDDVQAEPYSEDGDGGYTGCRMEGTSTLAEMGSSSDGPGLTLEDGVWTFAMDGADAEAGQGMSASMLSDFRISVTFPGEVLTHNGTSTVEGTTVTWTNATDLFSAEGLRATARDSGGAGGHTWLWIVLGVLALAAIGAAIWFATRKKSQPAAPPYPGQPYPGHPGNQPPYPPASQPYPQGQPSGPQPPYPPGPHVSPNPPQPPGPVQPGQEPHQPGFEPPRS